MAVYTHKVTFADGGGPLGWGKANHTDGSMTSHVPLAFNKTSVLQFEIWGVFEVTGGMGTGDFRVLMRAAGNVADDTNPADWPLTSIGVYDSTNTTLIAELNSTTVDVKADTANSPLGASEAHVLYEDNAANPGFVDATTYCIRYTGDFDEVVNANGLISEWTAATVYAPVQYFYGKKSGEDNKLWYCSTGGAAGAADQSFDEFATSEGADLKEVGLKRSPYYSVLIGSDEYVVDDDADLTNAFTLVEAASGGGSTFEIIDTLSDDAAFAAIFD
jgi:hypothetical protein